MQPVGLMNWINITPSRSFPVAVTSHPHLNAKSSNELHAGHECLHSPYKWKASIGPHTVSESNRCRRESVCVVGCGLRALVWRLEEFTRGVQYQASAHLLCRPDQCRSV